MITPAGIMIPLVQLVGRRMENPRVRSVLQAVAIASSGLFLAAAVPLGKDALTDPVTIGIALVSFRLLLTTKIDASWLILGVAIVSMSAAALDTIAVAG
jgi:chromate transporter